MDTQSMKKSRKVTIQDVLNEAELELLGITETVDGSPVSSARKRSEFSKIVVCGKILVI